MKRPEAEKAEPQFQPLEAPNGPIEGIYPRSEASNRPNINNQEQRVIDSDLDHEISRAKDTSKPYLETLDKLLDYPEAVLRLLDTHNCEEGIYRTIWKKYGLESQCDIDIENRIQIYDQRMMILKSLFNTSDLPPDMYLAMMRVYPSLVHYGEGRRDS